MNDNLRLIPRGPWGFYMTSFFSGILKKGETIMKHAKEKWELFSHKADMGIRGFGSSFEKAFEQGGLALMGVLMDPAQVTLQTSIRISCSAPTMDMLFYDWINELIYEMARQHLVFGQYHVKINEVQGGDLVLEGEALGETIDVEKHQLAVEIKGATFTELKAEKNELGTCIVQCVVDV